MVYFTSNRELDIYSFSKISAIALRDGVGCDINAHLFVYQVISK